MTPAFDLQYSITTWIQESAQELPDFPENFDPVVRPADPRFGDFQANGVLPLAKQLKTNPRQLATALMEKIAAHPSLSEEHFDLTIAGPGFINIRLKPAFLTAWTSAFNDPDRLADGLDHLYRGKTVVMDFSGPNTAKQMHVGHIRSTVIGEAISRLLSFCGAKVVRDNHIGDWGTQFGILLLACKRFGFDFDQDPVTALPALEDLYRQGNQLVEEDPEAKSEARQELVLLQNGDEERLEIWKKINELSQGAFNDLYRRLGVSFDLTLGESHYRDQVAGVCEQLESLKIAEESDGALVVFHPEHPRFNEQPFIIRKSDGASNYATTDLATVAYRCEELGASEIIYVTDGRQQDHFEQLFLTVNKWFAASGKEAPALRHVWFGTILGEGGKAIKTRSGGSVKLRDLIDEGVERARLIVDEKNPDLPDEEKDSIAEAVGIGAIRYADLMQNRTHDYVFSWDKMLSFDGNTAPYLLYAAARIHAIFRKAGLQPGEGEEQGDALQTEEEILLARQLALFPAAVAQVTQDLRPHFLCTYLFELANAFSSFYNANRVMVDNPAEQGRRLMLCSRTLLFLKTGLHLLGIETLEKM
ncbi:arginine--tRNA ligase [Puniceicoccus vermicola]|uniref:Arginine--tRNA ligase n=1 Tax=Puniceicoccus vermicola TaxID=388746 RepID=A0A7X1AVR7_9BACT|nr:arginine--tRNA ligase [Puniceicoccus vermicola]MBC2600737.1 arginine--tRNA ligase [Puniceicoccus vermicola]